MLILYRTPGCPRCSDIQEALEDLSVAHKVVQVRARDDLPQQLRDRYSLPLLVDEDEIVQGSARILEHLERLEHFKELWYKFQSDVCYCDSEGNVE